MNEISIINNIVSVMYISLTVISFMVMLMHFFKKETILTGLRLYNNGLSSIAFIPFILFGLMAMFSVYAIDPNFVYGYSLGVIFTMVIVFFVSIVILIECLYKWHKKLPNT